MAVSGGTIVPVPALESGMQIRDISADGAKVLAWKPDPSNEIGGGSLWLASSLGGTARKIGPHLAQDARWSPDGRALYFADNHTIYVTDADGTNQKKVWEAPDFVNEVIVSPDGRELVVTLQMRHNSRIWQLKADGTGAHPLLPDWPEQANQWSGQWTPDGKHFVFTSDREGRNNVYELVQPRWFEFWKKLSADLITGNQIAIRAMTPSRGGGGLFVLGEMEQGAMQVFDKDGKRRPFMDGASMLSFVISPDRQWMAYNEYPSGNLWKSRLDGSEAVQLTTTPAYMQEWSPDGKKLVYSDWYKLYVVSADGGAPEKLIPDEQSKWEVAPTWAPDGKSIAFNHFDQQSEPTEGIYVVDLQTRQLSLMPGSKGFYVASWSPDEKYMVALAQAPARMMLYTAATGTWTKLRDFDTPWGFWIWSHDSQSIYMEAVQGENGIYRLTVPEGQWEEVAGLNGVITRPEDAYPSLTAEGNIAVMSHTGVAQVYSLTWNQ